MKKEHEEIFKRYIVPTDKVYPLVKDHEEYVFYNEGEKYVVMGKRALCVLMNDSILFRSRNNGECLVLTGEKAGEKIDFEMNYFPADERARAQGRAWAYADLHVSLGICETYSQRAEKCRAVDCWVSFDRLTSKEEFRGTPVVSIGEVMEWVDKQNAAYKDVAEAEFKKRMAVDNMKELFSGAWKEK